MNLKQHFVDRELVELRIFAQNQGLLIEEKDREQFASELARQMLSPEHVMDVWTDLSPQARTALQTLARDPLGMPTPAFERRFGELRRIGPGRLLQDRPWKTPTGPGEELWYLGWILRSFRNVRDEMIEFVSIPDDLLALLPIQPTDASTAPFPQPVPPPAAEQDLGQMLLDDLGTLLEYVQNHQVRLRVDGRWRYHDLRMLTPRLKLSRIREQPLEAGGPLHLLFLAAKKLGLLVTVRGYQRFGKALRPWLEQSRAAQMQDIFHVWRNSSEWNDLCLAPELRCQEGSWANDPLLAREALLQELKRADPANWYALDAFIAMIYEAMPDFQRPDANYDTWYIQNKEGLFLHGFEHWHDVEGALIRFIWQGPLFWLGAVAWAQDAPVWRLTQQGWGFLHQHVSEPETHADAPILTISNDFVITLAPHIGLWDRLRVALFTFWQASEPEYRYLITQRGLKRARKRGVSASRILAFLERASGQAVPPNIRQALKRFDS